MCQTRPAEYIEAKGDSPNILQELEEYIVFHCTHGAKRPISYRVSEDSEPALYCCLKCAVNYIMKKKVKSKITHRNSRGQPIKSK